MSYDLHVFLTGFPSMVDWKLGFRKLGFNVDFKDEFDVMRQEGYLPIRLNGEEVGFPMFVGNMPPGSIPEAGPEHDTIATFTFHGDSDDALAAVVASAALAWAGGGILYDNGPGEATSGETMLNQAQEEIKKFKKPSAIPRSQWIETALRIARSVHPEYKETRSATGRSSEFVRRHESGLWLSQNFSKKNKWQGHSFALLFAREHVCYSPPPRW